MENAHNIEETETQACSEPRRIPRRRQRGLTLIEILVVVTILGMIAGLVGVAVVGQFGEAKVQAAEIQVSEISKALELYKIKLNRYPTTAEGLGMLVTPPKGKAPFMQKLSKDPWDHGYIYVSPGQKNRGKFDLSSKGPDETAGTEDDVTNWSSDQ